MTVALATPPPPDPHALVWGPEFIRLAGVSQSTFDTWVRDGRLPAPRRVGRRRCWTRAVVEQALAQLGR